MVLEFLSSFASLILKFAFPELVGAVSYLLLLSFLESFLAFTLVILITVLIPIRKFRLHVTRIIFIFLTTTLIWGIMGKLLVEKAFFSISIPFEWKMIGFNAYVLFYIITLTSLIFCMNWKWFEERTTELIDRVVILASVYLIFDFLGFAVVIIRNIG
jgi:hypothetical protein